MKKKEIYVIIVLLLVAILGVIGVRAIQNQRRTASKNNQTNTTETQTTESESTLQIPTETAVGTWVGIVHRDQVVQWFDSGVDGEYTVQGDVGDMHVEVKDGKWHVREVDCPNQVCVKMGWADENSIIPITCLPNNIYIGPADQLKEYLGA
ncbi:MAG: NusG domain II-containing protein [Erysipelotrichaceae bacterium]|nr:NusG domain II-containing protein [Erysipelotrichaceae bacterium]MDY6035417.1 NusG domain II-containing protein [Bulleidia sp.]